MKRIILLITAFFVATAIFGNKLTISNIERLDNSGARDLVKFTVSWENSWYVEGAPANYDAIWLFIKFRECGEWGMWEHARMDTAHGAKGLQTYGDHNLGTGLRFAENIDTNDRLGELSFNIKHNTGALIRRSSIGTGHITNQVCTLKVVGSSNDSTFDPSIEYDIKVFGIEMVYVVEGKFEAGDASSSYRIYDNTLGSNNPKLIDTELAVSAVHCYQDNDPHTSRNLPDSFPKGYNAFYCMKYEISNGQYCDFLNTVDASVAVARDDFMYSCDDYQWMGRYLFSKTGEVYSNSCRDRAMTVLYPRNLMAYLDWAALRPMTELEYEKTCRGPKDARSGEYVWGSTAADADYFDVEQVTGSTSGYELPVLNGVNNPNVNMDVGGEGISGGNFTGAGDRTDRGPVECGLFARDQNPETRVSSGAAYYGAMEMAGNVYECCIKCYEHYNLYTGIWGDGNVNQSNGRANVPNWPTSGYIARKGGNFQTTIGYAAISNNSSWANAWTIGCQPYYTGYDLNTHGGGRGVR